MPYGYDPRALRYRDTDTGRFLARGRALELANAAIAADQDVMGRLATLVSNGQLSPADWRDRMRREIKDAYIRQGILGRGGRAQMTAEDWGSVGGTISEQYRHLDRKLDNFYSQVQAGNLTEGQIAARARMYMNSSREAYERAVGRRLRGSAFDEVHWWTTSGESCSDCADYEGRGWMAVDDLPTWPGSGQTQCLTSCLCHLDYRRSDTGTLFEAEPERAIHAV